MSTTNVCVSSAVISTWYDLQQQHEFEAISEILFNVLNLCPGLPQVGVTPSCEGLQERRGDRGGGGGYTICQLPDCRTNTFTHTDTKHHNFTWCTHTRTYSAYTHTALRAGSKLLSKAWTVHFNLWPCYYCSCWRWETHWDIYVHLTASVDSTVMKLTSGLYYI